MSMLEKYVKINYPEIIDEYVRYTNRNNLPKIGDTVKTLRSGFGSLYERTLIVVDIDDEGITITDGHNEYYSNINTWYKDLEIINTKYIK